MELNLKIAGYILIGAAPGALVSSALALAGIAGMLQFALGIATTLAGIILVFKYKA